jgi:Divergent InlB B-repeat domain
VIPCLVEAGGKFQFDSVTLEPLFLEEANMTAWVWPISHLRSSGILGAVVLIFASLIFSSQLALGQSALQINPSTGIVASGPQGGPFSPSTFKYTLAASGGFVRYSITNVPTWLTASSTSGTVTRLGKTITFTVNSNGNKLQAGSYVSSINFENATNPAGSTTLVASLRTTTPPPPPPPIYTIAVSASPTADGTVSGGGAFPAGSSQTVTATANSGYNFVNWTANGSAVSTSASYTFTLNSNVTLVANFTQSQYTIAVSASPSAGGTVSGGGAFPAGNSQTVTATANSGYNFVNWTANGSVVSTLASYMFILNSNVTLVANFTPVTTATVTLTATPTSITAGQSSTLTWSSTNATSCSASGSWSGTQTVSGSLTVSPTANSTYTLTCAGSGGAASASASITVTTPSGNCGMRLGGTVIFCEPFDVVNAGIPSRTGALDPNVWGVSRTTGNVNFGVGQYNGWTAATTITLCDGTTRTVLPPNDVQICNGQLREASNDNPSGVFDDGIVTALAMYPKQPFDFAGRTGTVAFDVSNDSQGNHAAWPEFWMSDLPVPAPFSHFATWTTFPANGFGVRFAAAAPAGNPGLCPNLNNINSPRWTVDSAIVVRNYISEDDDLGVGTVYGTPSNPPLTVTILDCVIAPAAGSGVMNHIEIQVTQSEIDVYATDAGVAASPTTLRKIASITNANLTFTRGLIWLEDVHYNADKETVMLGTSPSTSQRNHTFVWDNVAFDGPFTDRDFAYDALDIDNVDSASGSIDLGQFSLANQTASWNVLNVPANPQAKGVRVLFNFYNQFSPIPTVLNVIVNGNAHKMPWPYPDMLQNTWRTFAVTIPITDLVAGTNVVQLGTDQPTVTSNVDIVLAGVPGGVPVLPGNSTTYPGGQTPIPTDTLTASPTSITAGRSSILTWSSTNATSCSGSGGWSVQATNGASSVSPSVNTTYTLACTGAGGSATASASVTVTTASTPTPTVTLTATPTLITVGQSSTITWSSTNATSCSASGTNWSGTQTVSGSLTVSPTANSAYTLTCAGSGGSASASASITVTTASLASANCNLSAPAFCDTFNEGPSVNNGRGGDLNPANWTASRLSGEIGQSGQGGLNPQLVAPIPACRATFTQTTVYSPWDTLICDPSGAKTSQLMTAASIQNYGTNSYMILQPFNFAGRTGKIDFDVDAVGEMLGGYPEVDITDQPVPAPTFREFYNFEVGSIPQNAIIVKFGPTCGVATSSAPYNVMVYNNYVGTILTPTYSSANGGCVQTSAGLLNHFEVQLSQTQITIYGSDFSPDNVTFPNYKLLYQASINLPFTQGYVHIDARNHATLKYSYGPDAIFHWDNVGFDGPVLPSLVAYEIPDNTTVSTFTGDSGDPTTPAINLGYLLLDGTTGKAAGMYDPVNLIPSLSFQNVNLSGRSSATLTFNAWFNAIDHAPQATWGISYQINGGAVTTVYPTAAQIAAMSNNVASGYEAFFTPVINVPLNALVQGTNTIRFLPVNAPMDYPPVVTNIDLLLGTSGSAP